jgi:hypothetical protein
MKYTVVYCINAPSAAINTCKNVFSFGQKGGQVFIYISY